MHRADLLAGLLRAAGPERVRWGAEVSAVEGSGVRLADGTSESADLLVGADGLNSIVRAAQLGPAPARDSGIVAWRGVTALPAATPAGEWWAPRTVAGLLPLSGGRLYWYLAYEGEEGDRAELERRAALFGDPVPGLIAGTAGRGPALPPALRPRSRSRAGARSRRRCSATPRTRCCRSSARAPARRSRTRSRSAGSSRPATPISARRWPPTSSTATRARRRSSRARAALPRSRSPAPASPAPPATCSSASYPSGPGCGSSTTDRPRARAPVSGFGAGCPYPPPVVSGVTFQPQEDPVKYMLLIHQGDTPTPRTPDCEQLSEEAQREVYAALLGDGRHRRASASGCSCEDPETAMCPGCACSPRNLRTGVHIAIPFVRGDDPQEEP